MEFLPTLILGVVLVFVIYVLHTERRDKDSDLKDILSLQAEEREKLLDRLMSRDLPEYKAVQEEPEKEEEEEEAEVPLDEAREEIEQNG